MATFKCAICGAQSTPKGPILNIHPQTLETESTADQWWSTNCTQVLGNVLFGSPTHILAQYFKSAKYCSTCSQVMKDFQHFAKQLEYYQRHLNELAKDIRNRINLHYVHNSQQNLNYDLGLARLKSLSNANDVNILNNYDRIEMEEMIYAAVCNRLGEELELEANQVKGVDGLVNPKQEMGAEKESGKETFYNRDDVTTNELHPHPNDSVSVDESYFEDAMDFQPSCEVRNDEDVEPSTSKGVVYSNSEDVNIIVEVPAQCPDVEVDILDNPLTVDHKSGRGAKRLKTVWYQTSKKNIEFKKSDTKVKVSKYICKFCNKAFGIVYDLHKHVDKEHSDSKGYFCLFCKDKSFATLEILKLHFDKCHHKCQNCPLVFETKIEHDKHFIQKHEKNVCGICLQVFKFKKEVDQHLEEMHSKDKDTYCSICREGFSDKKSYADHLRQHDESKNRCKTCSKGFLNKFELAEHEKIHKSTKLPVFSNRYACSICNKVCVNAEILDIHTKNHRVEGNSHECNICAELCFSKANLNDHYVEVHKKGDKFFCSKCLKEFKFVGDLKKHLYTHENDLVFQCQFCFKRYNNRKYLKRHEMYVHNKNRERIASLKFKRCWSQFSHFCQFCGRGYKEEAELNGHVVQAHQGPNPFTCGFCPEFFSNSVDLKNHTRKEHPTIEEVKKFKCSQCDKSFVVGKYLEDHMKIHGDPSLLVQCPECPKTFINEVAMKSHLLIHSTTIQFQCTFCEKGFTYKQAYMTHLRNNHLEKSYKCSLCDKMFANLQRLRNHEATHTGMREFHCQYCDKGFNTEANMRSHVKIIHFGQSTSQKKKKAGKN